MNKKKIDEYIPIAYDALKASTLTSLDGKKMQKTYRGYVSSFGAAIIMGSVRAAVAYNLKDANRNELMRVIFEVLEKDQGVKAEIEEINTRLPQKEGQPKQQCDTLFCYVTNCKSEKEAEENIYNAAIAVKLAMNQFELIPEKNGGEHDEK